MSNLWPQRVAVPVLISSAVALHATGCLEPSPSSSIPSLETSEEVLSEQPQNIPGGATPSFDDSTGGVFRVEGSEDFAPASSEEVPGSASEAPETIDILSRLDPDTSGFLVHGSPEVFAALGSSVSSAGDVNGDGLPDILVGAVRYNSAGRSSPPPGAAYVIFSSADRNSHVDLSLVSDSIPGLVLEGTQGVMRIGAYVAPAGDVNGDGFDDLLVNAFVSGVPIDFQNLRDTGRVVVVFGSPESSRIDLVSVLAGNGGGFAIEGENLRSGYEGSPAKLPPFAPAGDINGDGLDDILVQGTSSAGLWAVFGKQDFAPVQLTDLVDGIGGAPIYTQLAGTAGLPVALGDTNGDGLSDFAAVNSSGVEVFWGRQGSVAPLASEPDTGFLIEGLARQTSEFKVAAAGDINGDGLDDILIGAKNVEPLPADRQQGVTNTGTAYVVFGKANTELVELNAEDVAPLGSGFAVRSEPTISEDILPQGEFGSQLVRAGDLNDDGLDDFLVSDFRKDVVYAVFGKTTSSLLTELELERGIGGRAVLRHHDGLRTQFLGESLGNLSDINGDGFSDVIIGAVGTRVLANSNASGPGAAYVMYGPLPAPPATPPSVAEESDLDVNEVPEPEEGLPSPSPPPVR